MRASIRGSPAAASAEAPPPMELPITAMCAGCLVRWSQSMTASTSSCSRRPKVLSAGPLRPPPRRSITTTLNAAWSGTAYFSASLLLAPHPCTMTTVVPVGPTPSAAGTYQPAIGIPSVVTTSVPAVATLAGAVPHVRVLALEDGVVGDVVVHRLVRPTVPDKRGPAVGIPGRMDELVGPDDADVGRVAGQPHEGRRGQERDHSAPDPPHPAARAMSEVLRDQAARGRAQRLRSRSSAARPRSFSPPTPRSGGRRFRSRRRPAGAPRSAPVPPAKGSDAGHRRRAPRP